MPKLTEANQVQVLDAPATSLQFGSLQSVEKLQLENLQSETFDFGQLSFVRDTLTVSTCKFARHLADVNCRDNVSARPAGSRRTNQCMGHVG